MCRSAAWFHLAFIITLIIEFCLAVILVVESNNTLNVVMYWFGVGFGILFPVTFIFYIFWLLWYNGVFDSSKDTWINFIFIIGLVIQLCITIILVVESNKTLSTAMYWTGVGFGILFMLTFVSYVVWGITHCADCDCRF